MPTSAALTRARCAAATSWAAIPTLLNTVTSSPIAGWVPASRVAKVGVGLSTRLDQVTGLDEAAASKSSTTT